MFLNYVTTSDEACAIYYEQDMNKSGWKKTNWWEED